MKITTAVFAAVAAYTVFWSFYVIVFPALGRLLRAKPSTPIGERSFDKATVAVIVPAHNMQSTISRCIDALLNCGYPANRLRIHVVADHCTDRTATLAREAGVDVLVRDEGPAGKTYTLAWALRVLEERGESPDIYVVTDATARVAPGFLTALVARWQHGEDIVVGHSVVDTANQRWFAKCLGLTLVHRNMQNLARERLGLSALIEGRGMAYSRDYIQRFGWSLALPTSIDGSIHPTEDWRHGVRIAEHGFRVAFAYDARVLTPLRETLSAATQQGIRWERGRMANAVSHGGSVLVLAIKQRNFRMALAALDAVQLPVAILGALCVLIALLASLLPLSPLLTAIGYLPLVLLVLYGIAVVAKGRQEGIPPSTIAWAPIYVLWRCLAFVIALLSRPESRAKGPETPV